MKYRAYIYTLALLGALALTALSGGLLPSDNLVHAQQASANRPPAFSDGANATRDVEENTPPGFNLGDPITAIDPDEDGADNDDIEFGDTLTYSLEGADADLFNLDPLTGQLSTKAPLDFESPRSGSAGNSNNYKVTVRVRDTRGGSTTITVTISVTDVSTEPPAAPAAPTVVSGPDETGTDDDESTTTLKVLWHPPENMGDPFITDYDYRYKKTTDPSWTVVDNTNITDKTAKISDLTADTSYLVSVRATSDEGTSPWSLSGTGSTNRTINRAPAFSQDGPLMPTIPENSPARQDVGVAVRANDRDTGTLSYQLKGPDADSFDFITSSGQIRTKRGVTYDHEDLGCGYVDTADMTSCTYYVTVAAFDGAGGSDAIRVEIKVTDVRETPSIPGRPTVGATEGSRTSLDVSWSEPATTGPPITGYNVQYRRKDSNDEYSNDGVPDPVTGTSTIISGNNASNEPWLTRGTAYEVRVRAIGDDEGTTDWSPFGTGSTNMGNLEPAFRERPNSDTGSDRREDYTLDRTVAENTPSGRPVGGAVAANDGNGDKRTYKLVAVTPGNAASDAAAAKFDINESTGQIQTKESLNHEDTNCGYVVDADSTECTYTVNVDVRDGLNENRDEEESETAPDDSITVKITVRDLDEPPSVPTVTVTSPTDVTTLAVVWEAANTGPPITNYDVAYRQGSGAWLARIHRFIQVDGVRTAEGCEGVTGAIIRA